MTSLLFAYQYIVDKQIDRRRLTAKMRQKQAKPNKRAAKLKIYSPSAMFNAYKLVKETGMPIKTAARQYGVPHNTLRDRVKGRVDPEVLASGPAPLFSQEEEAKLVDHIKTMADLGYGFTISEVVNKASDYAVFLKKRTRDKPLSMKWFRGFRRRWPELHVIKPRALSRCRASSTTQETVDTYFTNLQHVLTANNLQDKPQSIYNIDEKGVQTEHSPPCVVGGKASVPAITSARTAITTIIGGGNAIGTQLPPFFVFKGQRMNDDLLKGSTTGSAGTMTKSGWSNSSVFHEYLDTHFIKYVQRGDSSEPILLIFDGHKSHTNVHVIDWAKKHNVILFVLPAHTSHVLQPLDVGYYGPLQKIYNSTCHKFLRENPSTKITRYNVAALASSSYVTALSHSNLCSSFERTGIFPLDRAAISNDIFKPSTPFVASAHNSSSTDNVVDENIDADDEHQQPDPDVYFTAAETVIDKKREFQQSKQMKASSLVSGKEITNNPCLLNELSTKSKSPEKTPKPSRKRKAPSKPTSSSQPDTSDSPRPGPSKVTNVSIDDSFSSDEEIPEEEKCCVCKLYQPIETRNCVSVVFTKWAQCDYSGCNHWTHLKYCCKQKVIRLNDKFICPCHDLNNTEE